MSWEQHKGMILSFIIVDDDDDDDNNNHNVKYNITFKVTYNDSYYNITRKGGEMQ
jgi:hypothetical protein